MMRSLDGVLADMDLHAIDWLVDALDEAARVADNAYVQPEYQVRQEQVIDALWKIAGLVKKGYIERSMV